MKRIRQIDFNWFFSPADNCTHCEYRVIGVDGVQNIEYCAEYGSPFFRIDYLDGRNEWIYHVNQVYWDHLPPLAEIHPLDPNDHFPF